MMKNAPNWSWIPSLYFAQGMPYVIVTTVSVIMYKNFGLSNAEIALYTSWLNLPFVIKPLWSPFIELFKTKRFWIISFELILGALFAAIALVVPGSAMLQASLALFALIAFCSATHDIGIDGFYMLALQAHQQAAWVGVRAMFFRIAMLTGQGAIVFLAGSLHDWRGDLALAWSIVFFILATLFIALSFYHRWVLPKPEADAEHQRPAHLGQDYLKVFLAFFKKPQILTAIAFLLLYRFGEAQLLTIAKPFLLDKAEAGGLGLSNQAFGLIYGSFGMVALTLGGILGGAAISRWGLKTCLWPMALAINLPHLVYVWLALQQPDNLIMVGIAVAFEQFGYGFGFAAYILFMIMLADGEHKTAHYAICTGFMAASIMLPGMFSGHLQQALGYQHFFIYVCAAALATFLVCGLVRIPADFGKKQTS